MAKYKRIAYKHSHFCGGSNINLKLIMCEDKIIILLVLQSYVLHCYHKYLVHPGMDRMEARINQTL